MVEYVVTGFSTLNSGDLCVDTPPNKTLQLTIDPAEPLPIARAASASIAAELRR